MEYANWFVVVMGVGIVFFGLIVLIIAVTIMGKILGNKGAAKGLAGAGAAGAGAASTIPGAGARHGIPSAAGGIGDLVNDMGLVAAISAAIADDMGTDVSAVRIHSIRKVA
ncbi:MAG: OadG family protein [Firmicutes bacterium]|nr:OadG family protein [Bacillota bacterium]